MNLQIFIDYKLLDYSEWHTVEMLPEEYFDMNVLDEDEKLAWDSIPEYDDAVDYLDVDITLISNTRIRISDRQLEISKVITTTLWNQGQNRITERVDTGTQKKLYQMIVVTKIHEEPSVWEIMRFVREDGVLKLEFHSFIRDNEDGSETEKIVYPAQS